MFVVWRSALLYCAANLERIFNDADNVAQASLLSSVQQTAAPGVATQSVQASNVAVSMFDDDLDLGTPSVVAGSKRCASCVYLCALLSCVAPQFAQVILRLDRHRPLHWACCASRSFFSLATRLAHYANRTEVQSGALLMLQANLHLRCPLQEGCCT